MLAAQMLYLIRIGPDFDGLKGERPLFWTALIMKSNDLKTKILPEAQFFWYNSFIHVLDIKIRKT